ncbi:MAG: ABC transporter ATP-binding protein [Lachnospiraceae bacterium]|nr:ABC transporter ATP-binding protein [Lachnospiraceae bacterium]
MEDNNILEVHNLKISLPVREKRVMFIRGVDLSLPKGKILALVGESGSGKTLTARSLMSLLPKAARIESGEILLKSKTGDEPGTDLAKLSHARIVNTVNARRIGMVFQDPLTTLNPTMTVGKQLAEGYKVHEHRFAGEAKKRALELLASVGLPEPERCFKQYPHELSGGMRQRVIIAIALSLNPDILICDEPTTSLDVTIQARILELLKKLQAERQLSVLYITHDLGVVAEIADIIYVMYAGRIVEEGSRSDILYHPAHPYTWGLLSSVPDMSFKEERLISIPGTPPDLSSGLRGDPFAPRNAWALPEDFEEEPPMFRLSSTHAVRSRLYDGAHTPPPLPENLARRIGNRSSAAEKEERHD